MTVLTTPTPVTNARRAQRTLVVFAVAAGIAASLVAYPPRTSHWEASASLRVGTTASDAPNISGVPTPKSTSLESYRLTVLASNLVLRTFAALVESPRSIRTAADSVGITAEGRSTASVFVSGSATDTVLTITVKAPTGQTASKLAGALRDGGARYLNDLDNTYDVSASSVVVQAVKITSWDLARINALVLFWDLVIMVVVWRYRRQWRDPPMGRSGESGTPRFASFAPTDRTLAP
jgi:hypothetical protein